MLQTALPDVTPVLTPRTLHTLIQSFEEQQHSRKGDKLGQWLIVLRDLQSLTTYLQSLFLPLFQSKTKRQFSAAFEAGSQAFEPYRFYLNTKLLPLVQEGDFLDSYRDVLDRVTSRVLAEAFEKGFPPDRLRSMLDRYFGVFQSLFLGAKEAGQEPVPREGLPVLAEFVHLSTRFDYGLTATYLALEGSLPIPTKRIASLMLASSEAALIDLVRYSPVVRELQRGGNWQLRLAELHGKDSHENLLRPQATPAIIGLTQARPSSSRSVELNWLQNQPHLSTEFGGKWIVVDGDRLIASDTEYERARDQALKAGVDRPFIIYISPEQRKPFMGL